MATATKTQPVRKTDTVHQQQEAHKRPKIGETLSAYITKASTTLKEHDAAAHIAARFLLARFPPACADAEPNANAQVGASATPDPAAVYPELYDDLVKYVAFVLWRPRQDLPTAILFGSLYLLDKRSKIQPAPTEGHYALFIIAYMLAGHMFMNDSYKLVSWRKIGSELFSPEQMMKFEREFCRTLHWEIAIHGEPLEEFVRALAGELEQLAASGDAPEGIKVQVQMIEDFVSALAEELLQLLPNPGGSVAAQEAGVI